MAVIIGNYIENREKFYAEISAKKEQIFTDIRVEITNAFDSVTSILKNMGDTLEYLLEEKDSRMYEALQKNTPYIFFELAPLDAYKLSYKRVWSEGDNIIINEKGFFIKRDEQTITFEELFKLKDKIEIPSFECYLRSLKRVISNVQNAQSIFFNRISNCKYV